MASLSTLLARGARLASLILAIGLIQPAIAAERIAVVDWAQAETLLALGVTPVAMADVAGYRDWVGVPALPESVADLGSRRSPNVERLAALKPDLILSHDLLAALEPRLSQIAPVESVVFGGNGADAWQTILSATDKIGRLTGHQDEARLLADKADALFAAERQRLADAGLAGTKVYVVRLVSDTALRVDGARSMAAEVIDRLGLTNAYDGPVNEWGFAASEIDTLAGVADAFVLVVGPNAPGQLDGFFQSPVGRTLPPVRQGRVRELPVVWTYGGIPSAMHMAQSMSQALLGPTQ